MMVHITEKDLPSGACFHGRLRFRKRFPSGIRVRWTWRHSLWAATFFAYYGYLVKKGLAPALTARDRDLRNVKLHALRDIESADFTGAIVSPGQRMPQGWREQNGRMLRARD